MLRPMRNLQPRSNLTYQEKNLVAFRIVVAAAIMDPKSIVWLAILARAAWPCDALAARRP